MKSFAVLALLVTAVAAASLRVWDCPVCGHPPAPVNCLCCRDTGRVSWLLRARRAPSDPRVLALFDDPRSISPALGALLGTAVDVDILYSAEARFAVCDGEEVVVAIVNQARRSKPPAFQRAEAWMFRPGGERLDHVMATRETAGGGVSLSFGVPDTELWLLTNPGGRGATLWPDGGPPEILRSPPDLDPYRYCRFRFSQGRFERIAP